MNQIRFKFGKIPDQPHACHEYSDCSYQNQRGIDHARNRP